MVKFQFPNPNTYADMNYFPPPLFGPVQTDDRQKVMHKSPLCKLHRWAQKWVRRGVKGFYDFMAVAALPICAKKHRLAMYQKAVTKFYRRSQRSWLLDTFHIYPDLKARLKAMVMSKHICWQLTLTFVVRP